MNLKKYDNKCVQIKCIDGKIYEGICQYDSPDYCFHEYGKNEEALEIFHFLFYKKDIISIKIIDNFTNSYGEIEKETFEDGISFLEQALEDEEDIHVYRLLCYMETVPINDEIVQLLNKLIKYNENYDIKMKAKLIINKYEEKEC